MAPTVLNPNYKLRNVIAYNLASGAAISFAVFLSTTQPFYLSEVLGVSSDNVGRAIGKLSAVDEITALCVSPLIGTLNDRLNGYAWNSMKMASGPRILMYAGFTVFAITLLCYGGVARHLFPELYIFRMLFALAMSGVMSTAVVMLHEANNSDFYWKNVRLSVPLWKKNAPAVEAADQSTFEIDEEALNDPHAKKQGKLSAVLGVSTGLGALFAMFFFVPLPYALTKDAKGAPTRQSIIISYTVVAVIAGAVSFYVFLTGYDCVKQRKLADTDPEQETPDASYWQLIREAIRVSSYNRKLQLAYLGGAVARASAVATTVFFPLMVFKFYSSAGLCGDSPKRDKMPEAINCREAMIFSAALTGVAQTVGLVLIPLWAILVDSKKYGCHFVLAACAALASFGSLGLCLVGSGSEPYDPRNATCFILTSCIGASQMGLVISSMALLSRAGQSLQDVEHRVIGSIAGLYSLAGGAGILLLAFAGGWSDKWVFGPFLIFGLINAGLLVATRASRA